VTNHLLHFLALDRSDPKKFQILQLIAALLGWTDEQREQAGLSRPSGGGAALPPATTSSFGSLRGLTGAARAGASSTLSPASPASMHRTPSTPSLGHGEFFTDSNSVTSPNGRETLAELWQNFLEQEAASSSAMSTSSTVGAQQTGRAGTSRQGSTSTGTGPGVNVPSTPTAK
jgi:hypothetical protein